MTDRDAELAPSDSAAAQELDGPQERTALASPVALDFFPTQGELVGRAYALARDSAGLLLTRIRAGLVRLLNASPSLEVLGSARFEADRAVENDEVLSQLVDSAPGGPVQRGRQRASAACATKFAVAAALASMREEAAADICRELRLEALLSQRALVERCVALVAGYAAAAGAGEVRFDEAACGELERALERLRAMPRPLVTARTRAEAIGELRAGRGCVHNGTEVPAPPFPLDARQAGLWYSTQGRGEHPWRVAKSAVRGGAGGQ